MLFWTWLSHKTRGMGTVLTLCLLLVVALADSVHSTQRMVSTGIRLGIDRSTVKAIGSELRSVTLRTIRASEERETRKEGSKHARTRP